MTYLQECQKARTALREQLEQAQKAQARLKVLEEAGRKAVEAEKRIQHPISPWILDLEAALAEEVADADHGA